MVETDSDFYFFVYLSSYMSNIYTKSIHHFMYLVVGYRDGKRETGWNRIGIQILGES